jgi:hypothetical protein
VSSRRLAVVVALVVAVGAAAFESLRAGGGAGRRAARGRPARRGARLRARRGPRGGRPRHGPREPGAAGPRRAGATLPRGGARPRAGRRAAARPGRVGERDLRPLLGNPAIAWASRVDALADGGLSWVATDGARLEELLEERAQAGRLRPAPRRARLHPLRRAGRRRRGPRPAPGRRARRARARGGPRPAREPARRAHPRGPRRAPPGHRARVPADRPGGRAPARRPGRRSRAGLRVPWLRALRRAALRLDAGANGLVVRARLETPAGTIRPQDLPIARGPQAPVPRGRGRSPWASARRGRPSPSPARSRRSRTRPTCGASTTRWSSCAATRTSTCRPTSSTA